MGAGEIIQTVCAVVIIAMWPFIIFNLVRTAYYLFKMRRR
jgi:hypothetical protein